MCMPETVKKNFFWQIADAASLKIIEQETLSFSITEEEFKSFVMGSFGV